VNNTFKTNKTKNLECTPRNLGISPSCAWNFSGTWNIGNSDVPRPGMA
jgi:hypothetical protein